MKILQRQIMIRMLQKIMQIDNNSTINLHSRIIIPNNNHLQEKKNCLKKKINNKVSNTQMHTAYSNFQPSYSFVASVKNHKKNLQSHMHSLYNPNGPLYKVATI